MRIHSDFRDYYDIGLSMGVDTTLHYNRRERGVYMNDLKAPFPPDTLSSVRLTRDSRPPVERVLIGFCGTIYPCIRILSESVVNIYVPDKLDDHFRLTIPSWGRPSENWERNFRKEQRNRAAFLSNRPRADALFLEINAPIFTVREDPDYRMRELEMIANPSLREYEFAKAVDPFTAFQEISMYLGNQLVKHDQPDKIADEYRIAQHGFDKHSFRHPVAQIGENTMKFILMVMAFVLFLIALVDYPPVSATRCIALGLALVTLAELIGK